MTFPFRLSPAARFLICGLALFGLLALAGCGGRRLTKVSGEVTLDGKPLPNASVTFHPAEGRPAEGTTDTQGKFTLKSFTEGDGVAPGEYRVTVFASVAPVVEGPPGGDAMAMMDAERKKPSGKLVTAITPPIYLNVEQTPLRVTVPPSGPVKLELKSTGP